MTPVDQTEFSNVDVEPVTHGNCLSACLASILDMPIADIPNYATVYQQTGKWIDDFESLLLGRGYQLLEFFYFPQNGTWEDLLKQSPGIDGYFICCGPSPRESAGGHAVIYKDGVLFHDPHPSRAGLLVLEDAYIIERV